MKTINSFRSKLFALTLTLMASVSTFAYDFQSGYLFYNILPDGTVAVTSETYGIPYDYLPNSLVIPSEVNGYNGETYVVTEIANYAFSGCSMLDTLVIPNTVKKIGMYAFTGCTKLVYISFPESIEDILGGALYECAWYNNQPDGLIYIGNLLYRYKGTAPTGTIVVKDGTKAILDFTFSNQPNIQSVVLPESVTSIHIQAFGDCPNLESVVLPSKLEAIEDHTFQYCEKLTNIKLPDALKLIGKNAFIGCTNLTKLTLPSSVQIIEDEAFANCTSLTEVTCYATIPPVRGDVVSDSPSDWFFAGVDVAKIPLYVPTESIDLYKKAEQWMFFNPILPIEPTTSYKSQWCDTWNVMFSNGSVYPPSNTPYRYQLAKDTVIGERTYTAVVQKEINDALDAPRYVAAVRFTDDRKVYIYYDNAEYLLYDFNVQEGDELEVFAGINNYRFGIKTYKCIVTGVEQYACIGCPATITLHVPNHPDDFTEIYRRTQWQEGVGDVYSGFLNGVNGYVPVDGGGSVHLLCAYQGDELKYTGPLYEEYGCGDNAEQSPEDLFPTLWGLQRTVCNEYCGETEDDNSNNITYKQTFTSISFENNKPYILCRGYLLREESNKILLYSESLNKEIVLYDFTLEVGDSLPAYIEHFDKTIYPADTLVVTDVSYVTLLDGKEYKKWTFDNGMEYVEGIGMYGGHRNGNFFGLIQEIVVPCHTGTHLVCVSKNGKLLYQMDEEEMERLGAECLCDAEQSPEDLFPTLWGLQQTICSGYYGEEGDEWASGLTGPSQEITMMDGKPYLQWGSWYLREENDKILVYSEIQKKDLVLYDFTLELGDTLTTLNLVTPEFLEYEGIVGIVDYPLSDYDYTYPIDTLVVTELSKETLLDGKEYTRWKFSDGTVYVEGIGSMSETFFHHIADHLPVPVSYLGSYLVCVSKNNKLLYQMDPVKMDELGAECLCDYDRGPRKDNAKDGQIGGRPTPTQWNQLEVVLREMDNNHTILQAETFSYTLEDISQQVNNKTYFQLARQSTKDTATTKSVVGALHFGKDEDNRVYFLRDGVEYILYDFTAEIGDTVEIFAGINNYPQETTYTHVVVDKDTTEDGACRMFLEVVFPNETNTTAENAEKVWLAGLGSVDGIVHNAAKRTNNAHAAPSRSASSETESSVMLCAWREDSCLYTTNHPDYDTFGCVYNQDPTSVEDISTSQSSYQKIIREGQFLILHNGKTYSVMGIEL